MLAPADCVKTRNAFFFVGLPGPYFRSINFLKKMSLFGTWISFWCLGWYHSRGWCSIGMLQQFTSATNVMLDTSITNSVVISSIAVTSNSAQLNCTGDSNSAPLNERCNCPSYIKRNRSDPTSWNTFKNECKTVGVELSWNWYLKLNRIESNPLNNPLQYIYIYYLLFKSTRQSARYSKY